MSCFGGDSRRRSSTQQQSRRGLEAALDPMVIASLALAGGALALSRLPYERQASAAADVQTAGSQPNASVVQDTPRLTPGCCKWDVVPRETTTMQLEARPAFYME